MKKQQGEAIRALEGQMSIFHLRPLFPLWLYNGIFGVKKGGFSRDAHGESKAAFLVPKMPILMLKTAISGTLIHIFQYDSLARPHLHLFHSVPVDRVADRTSKSQEQP